MQPARIPNSRTMISMLTMLAASVAEIQGHAFDSVPRACAPEPRLAASVHDALNRASLQGRGVAAARGLSCTRPKPLLAFPGKRRRAGGPRLLQIPSREEPLVVGKNCPSTETTYLSKDRACLKCFKHEHAGRTVQLDRLPRAHWGKPIARSETAASCHLHGRVHGKKKKSSI